MKYTQRLRELRKTKKLTQEQIAKDLNMKREQYRRYENGENEIKANHIIMFAKYYNVSTDYLLGLTDNPEKNWTIKSENTQVIKIGNNNKVGNINF